MSRRPVLAVFAAAAALVAPAPSLAVTFPVTSTANSGPGTLRQAIINANATAGKDAITFNIPGAGLHVITPAPPLPATTDPVVINATTQPGYAGTPLIQLLGSGVPGSEGLDIRGGASTVRGLDIVGWGDGGIFLTQGDGNVVTSNVIGADPSGRVAQPNYHGVVIFGSDQNRIGGKTTAERNLISGNFGSGITLTNVKGIVYTNLSENKNVVFGNYIGTTAGGGTALPNNYGVVVENAATGNAIGGTGGGGNLISGNKGDGISVFGDPDPSQHPLNTQIVSNTIGTTPSGTAALANGRMGIEVIRGDRTAIGGVPIDAGNLISGNGINGIALYGALFGSIAGNTIGTNAAETAKLPNGKNGIQLNGGTGYTRIGGFMSGSTIFGAPNLISGNAVNGIEIADSSSNSVLSNRIGTNGAGTGAIANGANGVAIISALVPAQNNKIGQDDAGNLISGNTQNGVYLDGVVNRRDGGPGATNNYVVANQIGTNAAGNNAVGNGTNGVQTNTADANYVTDNLIAGNKANGINLGISIGTTILRNDIGIQGVFGNATNGILINDSDSTLVKVNTIVRNGAAGVNVAAGLLNRISNNSIFSNGALGIDLGANGVTANDANDADGGANTLLNFPLLGSSPISNGSVTINGTYDGAPSTKFVIEFFADTSCDPSGYGEGRTYLAAKPVTTDAGGHASFFITVSLPYSNPRLIATAQDPVGNTSEFSPCIVAG